MLSENSFPLRYTPELIPRRGEITAWALSVVLVVALIIVRVKLPQVSMALPGVIVFFFLFSAASISLSNWMDRHSILRLDIEGIAFKNGLRNVYMRWGQIQSIHVRPVQWGAKKVQVVGEHTHFAFRTLGEVEYKGEIAGRTGFTQGDKILRVILRASGLQLIEDSNTPGYYYARE